MEGDIVNINLSKKFYGFKSALEVLNEEFKEFTVKNKSSKEFFNLYNKFFFELSSDTHKYFLHKSINYAYPLGYKNPRMIEIDSLKEQLKEIQREIDSIEKNHFFFKNGIFMASTEISTNDSGNLSSTQVGNVGPYYIQSGKKRKINNLDSYFKLKNRTRKNQEEISDQDFIIFVSPETLNGIPSGPLINNIQDIYLNTLEINIYPQTIESYNNSEIFDTEIPSELLENNTNTQINTY